jgi:hypothetical protein
MEDGRAFRVFLELNRRDFFERGQILQKLIDAQGLTRT